MSIKQDNSQKKQKNAHKTSSKLEEQAKRKADVERTTRKRSRRTRGKPSQEISRGRE